MRNLILGLKGCLLFCWLCSGGIWAQSPHVLNDFEGGAEGWELGFGTVNNIRAEGGKLLWETDGTGGAIRDSYNNTGALFQPGAGGVDMTGLSAIEFVNLMYMGEDPTIDVEMFMQVGVGSTFKGSAQLIGHDVAFQAGIPQSVTVPLGPLSSPEVAWVRVYGVNARTHSSLATWSLDEVRSVGPPAEERFIATFGPDTPDNRFQSVFVNFNFEAIQGNEGIANQDGLSIVPDAGVDGALQFVSLGGAVTGDGDPIGGALAIGNGAGNFGETSNDYWSRPTDISNYRFMEWLAKADGPEGATTSLSLYIQSGGYQYQNLGGQPVELPADGQWHPLTGELTGLNATDIVERIGINVFGHETNLTIQIDHIRGHNDEPSRITDWGLY